MRSLGPRSRQALGDCWTYTALAMLSVVFTAPFVCALSASFKTNAAIYDYPPSLIPQPVRLANYSDAVSVLPFWAFALNSALISLACVVGQLFSGSLAAFAFARLKWPGRDLWFGVLLATMMLPPQVTMVSTFVGWTQLQDVVHADLIDTYWPLIVPSFLGGSSMLVFLLRQFFKTLPTELDDAARIDGCGAGGVFLRVILPLSRPALATVAVLSFIAHWHDFLGPLIYLNSVERYTLQIGLRMFQDINGTRMNLLMAASMVVLLPVLLLFVSAQRYFVRGIALTGLKG